MDVKLKALLAIVPFGIAVAVSSSLAYPAYSDFAAKAQQVEDKKKEQDDLKTKLAARARIIKEQKEIETSIAALRDSVPKQADVEMLNIDLEKMCTESDVELVSFRSASQEELKKAGLEEKPEAAGSNMTKGKAALASKVKDAMAPVTGGAAKGAGAGSMPKTSNSTDSGLSKFNMQVKVVGDYAGIMKLAKKLESYQRVVAISELVTSVPKKTKTDKETGELQDDAVPAESDDLGDYHKLNGSILLTAYYLP